MPLFVALILRNSRIPGLIRRFPTLFCIGKWLLISSLIAICVGSTSAFFRVASNRATAWREAHPWIIAFLPIGGLLPGLLYHYVGRSVEAGNNLLLDTIHQPTALIPLRMAPLVLYDRYAFVWAGFCRKATLVLHNFTVFQRID